MRQSKLIAEEVANSCRLSMLDTQQFGSALDCLPSDQFSHQEFQLEQLLRRPRPYQHNSAQRDRFVQLREKVLKEMTEISSAQPTSQTIRLKLAVLGKFWAGLVAEISKECKQKGEILLYVWNSAFGITQKIVKGLVKASMAFESHSIDESIGQHKSYQQAVTQRVNQIAQMQSERDQRQNFIDFLVGHLRRKRKSMHKYEKTLRTAEKKINEYKDMYIALELDYIDLLADNRDISKENARELILRKKAALMLRNEKIKLKVPKEAVAKVVSQKEKEQAMQLRATLRQSLSEFNGAVGDYNLKILECSLEEQMVRFDLKYEEFQLEKVAYQETATDMQGFVLEVEEQQVQVTMRDMLSCNFIKHDYCQTGDTVAQTKTRVHKEVQSDPIRMAGSGSHFAVERVLELSFLFDSFKETKVGFLLRNTEKNKITFKLTNETQSKRHENLNAGRISPAKSMKSMKSIKEILPLPLTVHTAMQTESQEHRFVHAVKSSRPLSILKVPLKEVENSLYNHVNEKWKDQMQIMQILCQKELNGEPAIEEYFRNRTDINNPNSQTNSSDNIVRANQNMHMEAIPEGKESRVVQKEPKIFTRKKNTGNNSSLHRKTKMTNSNSRSSRSTHSSSNVRMSPNLHNLKTNRPSNEKPSFATPLELVNKTEVISEIEQVEPEQQEATRADKQSEMAVVGTNRDYMDHAMKMKMVTADLMKLSLKKRKNRKLTSSHRGNLSRVISQVYTIAYSMLGRESKQGEASGGVLRHMSVALFSQFRLPGNFGKNCNLYLRLLYFLSQIYCHRDESYVFESFLIMLDINLEDGRQCFKVNPASTALYLRLIEQLSASFKLPLDLESLYTTTDSLEVRIRSALHSERIGPSATDSIFASIEESINKILKAQLDQQSQATHQNQQAAQTPKPAVEVRLNVLRVTHLLMTEMQVLAETVLDSYQYLVNFEGRDCQSVQRDIVEFILSVQFECQLGHAAKKRLVEQSYAGVTKGISRESFKELLLCIDAPIFNKAYFSGLAKFKTKQTVIFPSISARLRQVLGYLETHTEHMELERRIIKAMMAGESKSLGKELFYKRIFVLIYLKIIDHSMQKIFAYLASPDLLTLNEHCSRLDFHD